MRLPLPRAAPASGASTALGKTAGAQAPGGGEHLRVGAAAAEREGFEPVAQAAGSAAQPFSVRGASEEPPSDAPGDPLGRLRDDSFGTALLAANAARGRKLAAFAEVDQAAAGCGLALCRGLDAAYRGDEAATVAALAQAYDELGAGGPPEQFQ